MRNFPPMPAPIPGLLQNKCDCLEKKNIDKETSGRGRWKEMTAACRQASWTASPPSQKKNKQKTCCSMEKSHRSVCLDDVQMKKMLALWLRDGVQHRPGQRMEHFGCPEKGWWLTPFPWWSRRKTFSQMDRKIKSNEMKFLSCVVQPECWKKAVV